MFWIVLHRYCWTSHSLPFKSLRVLELTHHKSRVPIKFSPNLSFPKQSQTIVKFIQFLLSVWYLLFYRTSRRKTWKFRWQGFDPRRDNPFHTPHNDYTWRGNPVNLRGPYLRTSHLLHSILQIRDRGTNDPTLVTRLRGISVSTPDRWKGLRKLRDPTPLSGDRNVVFQILNIFKSCQFPMSYLWLVGQV